MENTNKEFIHQLDIPQLETWLKANGEPAYRAAQIFDWLHVKRVNSPEEMSNIPAKLRNLMAESFEFLKLEILDKQRSQKDGTKKYLFEFPDKNTVEAVLMRYKHGTSLCISTQVGCRMGCRFCASTIGGRVRNLEPAEMLLQVYAACELAGERVDSLVLMGIGEPLDNYENVIKFIMLLTNEKGYNLGQRHISLSTCGVVPKINELAELGLGITLSVSLHAHNNATRSKIMPINDAYPIEKLLAAVKAYQDKTKRRISIEYSLIYGVNDSVADAKALAKLVAPLGCHVNLIPVNKVLETGYSPPHRKNVIMFKETLEGFKINATVRRELGSDISAACGQLRRQNMRGNTDEAVRAD